MAGPGPRPRVFITGGSGYLGQFLVHALAHNYEVTYAYGSRLLANAPPGVAAVKVDVATGDGLQAAFQHHGPFIAAINCAAISQPGLCEKEPDAARAVNVPSHLIAAMRAQQHATGESPLLIHISTDQVYEGNRPNWQESDPCEPINQYGRTKLEGESFIQREWPGSVILRSSIIYGQPAPDPVPRPLFLQFVDDVITNRKPTTFFQDEWRCPIYVKDIVHVVQQFLGSLVSGTLAGLLAQGGARSGSSSLVLNMGGPERLSRVDMALQVAQWRGLSREEVAAVVLPVPAASVARGVASPPDISMCSERLTQLLGIAPARFSEAIKEVLV